MKITYQHIPQNEHPYNTLLEPENQLPDTWRATANFDGLTFHGNGLTQEAARANLKERITSHYHALAYNACLAIGL